MPNLIDLNSTIEFGKLKLKNPYSLSNPASDDYLCAFDANDGELSKTKISVQSISNLNLTAGKMEGRVNDEFISANGKQMVYLCIQKSNNSIYEFGVTTAGAWAYAGYALLYWYI